MEKVKCPRCGVEAEPKMQERTKNGVTFTEHFWMCPACGMSWYEYGQIDDAVKNMMENSK